jgi:hypothetical protein
MKSISAVWFAAGFAATLAGAAVVDTASAQGYERRGSGQGYVVAESRFGNGVVRGAVRPTSLGPQVQLPGGGWIYCKRSCSETLRAETVDFWEAQQGPGGKEQGLFGYFRRW